MYDYFRTSWDDSEWDSLGFEIEDPLTESTLQMSEYATPNPNGAYNEGGPDPSTYPFPTQPIFTKLFPTLTVGHDDQSCDFITGLLYASQIEKD